MQLQANILDSKPGWGEQNRSRQRMAQPEEIAYGVLFLTSDESSFVTGHALVINGGQTTDA